MKIENALNHTLKWEGGISDNENDFGGYTKYGISKRQYPDVDIKNLTLDQAKTIYIKDYWNHQYNHIRDSKLVIKLFDLGVNIGVNRSVKLLQATLNKYCGTSLKEDGIFGGITLEAVNKNSIFSLYVFEASQYYKEISEKRNNEIFFKGWLNRLYDF